MHNRVPATMAETLDDLLIYSLWGAFLLVSPLPPPATRAAVAAYIVAAVGRKTDRECRHDARRIH